MTTILRTKVTLKDSERGFEKASRRIEEWLNQKAEPHGIYVEPDRFDYPDENDLPSGDDSFKLDFARGSDVLGLTTEYTDPDEDARAWKVDLALGRGEHSTDLSMRIGLLHRNATSRLNS